MMKTELIEGHVRVYQNIGGTLSQLGSDINGEATDDYSGALVLV